MRKRYVRVLHDQWGDEISAYRPLLRIDHQEFEVCLWTDSARANWFADQLAIALARLVERERGTP
jgi:hypothetical protein